MKCKVNFLYFFVHCKNAKCEIISNLLESDERLVGPGVNNLDLELKKKLIISK